jgi:hypothetical protein
VLQSGIVSSIVQISTPQVCAPPAQRSILNSPASNHHSATHLTVRQAFLLLLRHPYKYLLQRWNWKSAVLSSLLRASLFFVTNLVAGLPAAIAAMKTELVFREITSGFYGALTEAAYAYSHYGRSRAPKHFGGILGGGSGNDLFGLPFLRRHRVGRSNRRVRNRSG